MNQTCLHASVPRRRRGLAPACAALLAVLLLAAPSFAVGPGDPAPNFAIPLLEGDQKLKLADYRGKVVWLDFWASWCPPCLKSLPDLEALRKEMPEKHFQIVAINVDKDPKKALKFLAKNPVGYPSGSDPKGMLPEKFELKTMPTSYLIDRNGRIAKVHEGYKKGDIDKIRAEINQLMKAKR